MHRGFCRGNNNSSSGMDEMKLSISSGTSTRSTSLAIGDWTTGIGVAKAFDGVEIVGQAHTEFDITAEMFLSQYLFPSCESLTSCKSTKTLTTVFENTRGFTVYDVVVTKQFLSKQCINNNFQIKYIRSISKTLENPSKSVIKIRAFYVGVFTNNDYIINIYRFTGQ